MICHLLSVCLPGPEEERECDLQDSRPTVVCHLGCVSGQGGVTSCESKHIIIFSLSLSALGFFSFFVSHPHFSATSCLWRGRSINVTAICLTFQEVHIHCCLVVAMHLSLSCRWSVASSRLHWHHFLLPVLWTHKGNQTLVQMVSMAKKGNAYISCKFFD